ncbi:hypothetical protein RSA46_08060 [Pseudomonas oryzihabitans]|nr:hypothetical protein SB5_07920 [Pseudomonas psychrotolerans]KTT45063.1 hypothetical protein RSA46_08060 [Pseudomonas psychrotolerans]
MELFDTLTTALAAYRYAIWPLVSLLVLVVVIIRWWHEVKYFFLNIKMGLPVVGFVARAPKRDLTQSSDAGGAAWYTVERDLCANYYRYYARVNKDAAFYDKCANYLNKVEERGRKPTGLPLWVASIFLVVLEAFIFALVLAPFIANNISANQAEFSAVIISLLIGTILVPATHLMGAEIHRNGLISKAREWHRQARRNNNAKDLQANAKVDLDHTGLDDDEPKYLHIINRVKHNASVSPTWWTSIIATALILILAVGAYFIRSSTINELETQQVNGSPYASGSTSGFTPDASPFQLPSEAKADGQAADQRAASEVAGDRIFAYKLTFFILSVIFIGVQIIGVLIGVFRSFAGTQSREAAGYISGFSSASEFAAYQQSKRDQVARDAEAKLSGLQERIEHRHSLGGSADRGPRRSFALYASERERQASESQRQSEANELKRMRQELNDAKEKQALQRERAALENAALTAEAAAADRPEITTVEAPAPAAASLDQSTLIANLGDLTVYSPEELAAIGAELGLDNAALLSKQKVQMAIKRAKKEGA